MPQIPATLTNEIGSSSAVQPGGYVESYEENGDLRWPLSTIVYDRMRKTSPQIGGVLRAINHPIRRTKWHFADADVDPAVVEFCEVTLGLTEDAGIRQRRGEGIDWDYFVRHVLLHLPIGHMFFEQVYAIGEPPKGVEGAGVPPVVAHLAKLGPRMPRTITQFTPADDGSLAGIVQQVTRRVAGMGRNTGWQLQEVPIPISRLVWFVNEQEGGDPIGSSLLRQAYGSYFLRDQMVRLQAMIIERNGMGIPWATHDEGASEADAKRIVTQIRAGEYAGAWGPAGITLELLGVKGNTVDPLPAIEYHDRTMGKSVLAMFLDLGHEGGIGQGNIGVTFLDVFTASLNAVTRYMAAVINRYVVADLVRLNWGPDATIPLLVPDEITPDVALSAEQLKALVDAGIITPDGDLEDDQRRRHGLPPKMEDDDVPPIEFPGDPFLPAGPPMNPADVTQGPGLVPGPGLPPRLSRKPEGLAEMEQRIETLRSVLFKKAV